MSTTNNASYADCEDNSIGEQIKNTNCKDHDIVAGNIIHDLEGNSYLVVGVRDLFIDCISDKFDICSINRKWIGEYSIISNIDITGFLEFIKEAQNDG